MTSATYSGDTLTLHDGNTVVGNIELTGIGLDAGFTVTSVGNGLYDIGVACFLPETRVLTDRGEVAARDVAIGDRLFTASGEAKPVKWIGRRAYSASVVASDPHVAPVLIRQGALADNLPRRDLYLSPCHAMHLDGILIEAGHLVNGVSILRAPEIKDVEYINFEFEDHDIIFAEGAAAETGCCRGNRSVYDNADDYMALYPHEPRNVIKPYCAPRLDCGFEVEVVRRRIDARAGLTAPLDDAPGALKGWIENLDGNAIRGLAANADTTAPVVLELVINGAVIGEVIANHSRPARMRDLGVERCGFQFKLPEGLSPYCRHTISVRRASDGTELPGSPFMLEAATPLNPAGRGALEAALRNSNGVGRIGGGGRPCADGPGGSRRGAAPSESRSGGAARRANPEAGHARLEQAAVACGGERASRGLRPGGALLHPALWATLPMLGRERISPSPLWGGWREGPGGVRALQQRQHFPCCRLGGVPIRTT